MSKIILFIIYFLCFCDNFFKHYYYFLQIIFINIFECICQFRLFFYFFKIKYFIKIGYFNCLKSFYRRLFLTFLNRNFCLFLFYFHFLIQFFQSNFILKISFYSKKTYVKEMIIRKKGRIKNVKKFIKQNEFIFEHMLTSIENFEISWKTIDFI